MDKIKITNSSSFLVTLMLTLAVSSCAHNTIDRSIDSQVAEETSVKTQVDLHNQVEQLLETAPGLTADQRTNLASLRESTVMQLSRLAQESLKLKSVLMKELVASDYREDEIRQLKHRIKDNEAKRLTLTFDAIEEAKKILGHQSTPNQRILIMEQFWEGRGRP